MQKFFLVIAAISGFSATLLGAYGAHGLPHLISATQLELFHTALEYHFYHTIVLLVVALAMFLIANHWLKYAAALLTAGIILFSGNLYLISIASIKLPALITPIGGFCLLSGWVLLGVGLLKQ